MQLNNVDYYALSGADPKEVGDSPECHRCGKQVRWRRKKQGEVIEGDSDGEDSEPEVYRFAYGNTSAPRSMPSVRVPTLCMK